MHVPTPTVFLPCHTLDDFPTWLDDHEAADLLAAWTAAWHPTVIAATGRRPRWASLDLSPPDDGPLLGIVPASFDDRFAAQADGRAGHPDDRWVRGITGPEAVRTAAAEAVAGLLPAGTDSVSTAWIDECAALGLAVLLAELVARRMRSTADLDGADFSQAVVRMAEAAVAGRDDDARAALAECYGWLEASRARYYPVDVWLVDLVLLAPSTLGAPLCHELAEGVPLGIIAAAELAATLATSHPESLALLRAAVAEGRAAICSGLLDERPLDACTPEELAAALASGMAAWREHAGAAPTTFAQYTGCGSAILPQVLTGLGCEGVLWNRFDGARLPDPGAARIRWEGTGGSAIDGLARPPLDARSARTILELPERLGDTMDHDHTAAVAFASHAGTSSRWHGLLRRIGRQSTVLGTFVTPDELFRRTAGAGTLVSFEPDVFPPTLPTAGGTRAGAAGDQVGEASAAAAAEARRIVAAAAALAPLLSQAAAPGGDAAPLAGAAAGAAVRPPAERTTKRSWWGRARHRDEPLVLDNGAIRLQVHEGTGGIRSLRRPVDRDNRLSQQLAVRGTRPQAKGEWLSVDERAWHSRMVAEAIDRAPTPTGEPGVVSRGRLVDAGGRPLATFTQGIALAPGLPLALLDIDITLVEPLVGPALEHHLACRFAWHENEDVEIRRSLHTQAIVTDRSRFTAPHFVEIMAEGGRAAGGSADAVAVLTGGLSWHALSLPHVLDSLLAVAGGQPLPAGTRLVRRLAVGVGVPRVAAAAIELLAAGPGKVAWGCVPTVVSGTTRITVEAVEAEAGRPVRARIGLLESSGTGGDVRLEWAADVARAGGSDLRGRPRPEAAVAVTGRSTVVFLRRYEWLHLEVEFA